MTLLLSCQLPLSTPAPQVVLEEIAQIKSELTTKYTQEAEAEAAVAAQAAAAAEAEAAAAAAAAAAAQEQRQAAQQQRQAAVAATSAAATGPALSVETVRWTPAELDKRPGQAPPSLYPSVGGGDAARQPVTCLPCDPPTYAPPPHNPLGAMPPMPTVPTVPPVPSAVGSMPAMPSYSAPQHTAPFSLLPPSYDMSGASGAGQYSTAGGGGGGGAAAMLALPRAATGPPPSGALPSAQLPGASLAPPVGAAGGGGGGGGACASGLAALNLSSMSCGSSLQPLAPTLPAAPSVQPATGSARAGYDLSMPSRGGVGGVGGVGGGMSGLSGALPAAAISQAYQCIPCDGAIPTLPGVPAAAAPRPPAALVPEWQRGPAPPQQQQQPPPSPSQPKQGALRPLRIPTSLSRVFLQLAGENTARNIETCGILIGRQAQGALVVDRLLVPSQKGTANTCDTTNENEIYEYCDAQQGDALTLGWVHTHPTQTCFLSSVDLHTHCGYQSILDEAVAIVLSPRFLPTQGVFRLCHPSPPGLKEVQDCRKTGFHPEHQRNGQDAGNGVYEECGHVQWTNDQIQVVDLRKR